MRVNGLLLIALLLVSTALRAAPSPAEQKALKALKGKSFNARVDALTSLKHSHDKTVITAVEAALQDPDATVRWAAADALESMGDTHALDALKTASNDPSPLVANRARAALGALSNKGGGGRERTLRISARDLTHGARPLDGLMLSTVKEGFSEKKTPITTDASAPAAYTAVFNAQSLKETPSAGGKTLELACTATVSELPSGALRFATRVVAGVEVGANASDADRKDAVEDALKAASAGLAQETMDWLSHAP